MGPLQGVKVIEMAGLGPAPFCAMMLSDMGAEVLRIDRTGPVELGVKRETRFELNRRGRRSVAIDLKTAAGLDAAQRLISGADALIEGFRPGVMERLGLGPEACLAHNPRLVYGRMTGWGQEGPLASSAGHDINYIALAGALACFGRPGELPSPPLNLVGDYGGGAMYLAFGVVCALFEAARSGIGQVVDTTMLDGVSSLLTPVHGHRAGGYWSGAGAMFSPWYEVYRTKDDKLVSVGAIEGRFYSELLERMGLAEEELPAQRDPDGWPQLRRRFAETFATKTRDEWCAAMAGADACFAPVLTLEEAAEHPQMRERGTFVEVEGVMQPAPAPRFSRTRAEIRGAPREAGADTEQALADWGFSREEIARLKQANAIAQTSSAESKS